MRHCEKTDVSFTSNVFYSIIVHGILLYFVALLQVHGGPPSIAPPTVTFVRLGYAAETAKHNPSSAQRKGKSDDNREHADEDVSNKEIAVGAENKEKTPDIDRSLVHKSEEEEKGKVLTEEDKAMDEPKETPDNDLKEMEHTAAGTMTALEEASGDMPLATEEADEPRETQTEETSAAVTEEETTGAGGESDESESVAVESVLENSNVIEVETSEINNFPKAPVKTARAEVTEVAPVEDEVPVEVGKEDMMTEDPTITQADMDNHFASKDNLHRYAFSEYEMKKNHLAINTSIENRGLSNEETVAETAEGGLSDSVVESDRPRAVEPAVVPEEPIVIQAMAEEIHDDYSVPIEVENAAVIEGEITDNDSKEKKSAGAEAGAAPEEASADMPVTADKIGEPRETKIAERNAAVPEVETSGEHIDEMGLVPKTETIPENPNVINADAEDTGEAKETVIEITKEITPVESEVPALVEKEAVPAEDPPVTQADMNNYSASSDNLYKYAFGEYEKQKSHLMINTSIKDREVPTGEAVPEVADGEHIDGDDEPEEPEEVETVAVPKEQSVPQAMPDEIGESEEASTEVAEVAMNEVVPLDVKVPVNVEVSAKGEKEAESVENPPVTKDGMDNYSASSKNLYKYASGEYEKKETHLKINASIHYSEKAYDIPVESDENYVDVYTPLAHEDVENDTSHEGNAIQEIVQDAEQSTVMEILTPDENHMPSKEEYVITNHHNIGDPMIVNGVEDIILASVDKNIGISLPRANDIEVEILMESSEITFDIEFLRKSHPMAGKGNSTKNRKEIELTYKFERISVLKDIGLKQVYTLLKAEEGVYVFSLINNGEESHACDLTIRLHEGTQAERIKEMKGLKINNNGGGARLIFLMPEAIFWDDEEMFSGMIESSKEITKFNEDTGLVWKEKKDYVKGF